MSTFLNMSEIIPENENEYLENEIIQLNHYKSKTFEEFKIIRMRQRADFALNKQPIENVEETFKIFNKNDVEDLTAYNFYIKNCL